MTLRELADEVAGAVVSGNDSVPVTAVTPPDKPRCHTNLPQACSLSRARFRSPDDSTKP